ncbi:MAG TPA: patatin-like phospholipase family protein [Burkholderiaceae bacterium]|nr:patatin-like phospholipase family protein [Burkholderiaceae bacterium]
MWPWRLPPSRSRVALALQGGGAHGAFTWGVLDALLEHTGQPIVAASGTSAGAMNAVVLAHGLLEGGRDGARAALATFWQALGRAVPWDAMKLLAGDGETLSPSARWMMRMTQWLSPAHANPLRIDPLRDLVARSVDFERLARQRTLSLHIAATHANTGRLRVFGNAELSLDVLMASACLPNLQPAVMIDDEPYWDGGFSANPPVLPLLEGSGIDDVMIVMLSPWRLGTTPHRADEIRARTMEIAFTAAYLREMQWIAHAAQPRVPWLRGAFERRVQRTHWHLIDGNDHLSTLPGDSKLIAHQPLLERLRDAGRARTIAWLSSDGEAIGRRSSADLQRLFGGHDAPSD